MKTTYLLLCVIFGINCYSQNNLNQSINFETNLIGTSPNQNKTESHNTYNQRIWFMTAIPFFGQLI